MPSQQSNAARGPSSIRIVREALTRAGTVMRRHRVQVALDHGLCRRWRSIPRPSPKCSTSCSTTPASIRRRHDHSHCRRRARTTHHVRLSVTDEGPGIPPELREQVFQKFFRIPGREALDPRRSGIGLGLPIARRLVESQAGRIWIEAPGVGARHAVVLDAADRRRSAAPDRLTRWTCRRRLGA